jgi:hypothetical protein
MVARKSFANSQLYAGVATTFQYDYQVPSVLAIGKYSLDVGVWPGNWSTTYLYSTFAYMNVATSTVSAPVASSGGTGGLSNPGFESGMTGYESWGGYPQAVTGQAHSGSYSLQIAGAAGGVGRNILSLVSAGTNYVLSAYAKSTNPAEYAEISISFKNSAGTSLLTKTVQVKTTSYTQYSISFTAPSGASQAYIGVWKNGGTSVLNVDDFALTSGSVSAPIVSTSPTPTPTASSTPVASTPTSGSTIASGAGYPFGSHKIPYVAGIKVTAASQAAQEQSITSLYNYWKSTILINGCGGYYPKFSQSYAAVSEGVGYGMLITVIMAGYDSNAKNYFDGLFRFARNHPAYSVDSALMDWRINLDCSSGGGGWAAPDGDLDIAMALLMADKQWGSSGTINYKAEAIKTINALKAKETLAAILPAGGNAPDMSRTSDYMFTHFRAFKRATGDTFWDAMVNNTFNLIATMQNKYAPNTGLLPDWVVGLPNNPAPSPGGRIEGNLEGFYAWNACRDPWRIGADFVTSGDSRGGVAVGKMMDFFNRVTNGNPALIAMGYRLDGSVVQANSPGYVNPSFTGPALVGALVDSRFQTYLNSLWTMHATTPARGYYDTEIQLLSMVVASGNWWNP